MQSQEQILRELLAESLQIIERYASGQEVKIPMKKGVGSEMRRIEVASGRTA